MTIEEFLDCLLGYYQAEVRGEAFFEGMLRKFDKPDHSHNPKVAGSNPVPATMNDEGLADVEAANPSRLPDFTQEWGLAPAAASPADPPRWCRTQRGLARLVAHRVGASHRD